MDAVIEAVRTAIEKELEVLRKQAYHEGYNTCDRKWRGHMSDVSRALLTAPTKVDVKVKQEIALYDAEYALVQNGVE